MKNLIFRFRKRKKVKPYKVDTSQKGFEYVGIKLTDEQFQDILTGRQLPNALQMELVLRFRNPFVILAKQIHGD